MSMRPTRLAALDDVLATLLPAPGRRQTPLPEELARARAAGRVPMPGELERLYAVTNGAYLPNGAELFDLDDYAHINGHAPNFVDLPRVAYFGGDGGDRWFFIDVGPCIGRAAGAVYAVDRGWRDPDACVPCGEDLPDFLEKVAAGELPWTGPKLETLALERMLRALDAYPERWDGHPGASSREVFDRKQVLGRGVPTHLGRLLERTDGLRIARTGAQIFRVAAIEPVAGSDNGHGMLGGLWIGGAPDGTRYALSYHGWCDLAPNRVVAVPPGGDPARSIVLGPLADVLTTWLTHP